MIYSMIDDIDSGDDAGVRPREVHTGSEGAGYLFSEPHLRFSEAIETTTEADLA